MSSVPTPDEEEDHETSYADLVSAEDIATEKRFALSPKATKASSPYAMIG